MRVEPVNIQPVNVVTVPATVRPVESATQAPRSGIRPQDLNNLLRMSTYNDRGQIRNGMVNSFSELFSGTKIDTRA